MGQILDLLTPQWIEKRLAAEKAPPVPLSVEQHERLIKLAVRLALQTSPPETDAAEMEAKIRRENAEAMRDQEERENDPRIRVDTLSSRCISVCDFEYAFGSAPQVIRKHCHIAGKQALPSLLALDFSNSLNRLDTLSQLRLWYVAAVSSDSELARALATTYHAPPPSQVKWHEANVAILRCALAGDTEGEKALASQLRPGYPADFPPLLIELPLGVIGRDPTMILEGVRKLGTRFKGKWDLKKHRAYYEKRKPKTPGRPHPGGTWEEFLDLTKNHLFGLHWIFSWWAIAWLQVARHRGLSELFEAKNRKVFSEWVPLGMVETE